MTTNTAALTSKLKRKPILAIDFDGTLVESYFPKIGPDLGALFWLSQLKNMGCELVLWTCRTGENLEAAKQWLTEHGFDGIITKHNEHADANGEWEIESRKIFANFYVGDRAFGAPLIRDPKGKREPYYNWDLAGPILIREVNQLQLRWLKREQESE